MLFELAIFSDMKKEKLAAIKKIVRVGFQLGLIANNNILFLLYIYGLLIKVSSKTKGFK